MFKMPNSAPLRNRGSWKMPYDHSQPQRMTGYKTLSPIEGFHYNSEIFRYHPLQNPKDVLDFYMHRINPLPDSPPSEVQCNWRRRGEYHGQGTSRRLGGAPEEEAGSSETAGDQRYAQLEAQMVLMQNENVRLQEELKGKGKQPERG